MEHFHRAARNTIGLAQQHAARLLLDDASLDVGKRRKLRRQRQARRPTADDQHVDFLRNRPGHSRWQDPLGGIGDVRLARLEAVQVELHALLASCRPKK
jgi:hypothetical protein